MSERFILDLASNPHPLLLALCIDAKQEADEYGRAYDDDRYYAGVIDACSAATGETPERLMAWVAYHEHEREELPNHDYDIRGTNAV